MLIALENYSTYKIKKLLKNLELHQYTTLVDENKITGLLLDAADEWEDLGDVGIENRIHAKVLLKRIKEIKLDLGDYIFVCVLLYDR